MLIAIKLEADAPADTLVKLRLAARTFSPSLTRLVPDAGDQPLGRYYSLDVSDPAEAERIAEQLRRIPAVAAAYVKPSDALP